ncbi:isoprenylcysteine carboxylmethyltransferase family protein [Phenylobacterium sp.]|jgi:protein-S-isoprenylcysteine O-methyltransferase Ste14|uniref:methyltransferase family protein n=1 Tax=Phenylobacterium sp. TaxID=1871053 RepID=UPI002F3F2D2B
MTNPVSPGTERLLLRLMDLGERAVMILLFAGLVIRFSHGLQLHPYNALAVVSEGFVVLFIVLRREAATVTTRPKDWAVAMLGTMLPLMVQPGGDLILPAAAGTALMFAGLSISVWAKLTLRRSFGVAAANRGVVDGGPYRFVRHPMYAGYLLVHIGFLLNNPLPWNAALYAVTLGCQIARILAEEKVLAQDAAYACVLQRVRYRLIPCLF